MIPSNRFNTIVSTVTQSLVLFYQAIAVLVFTVSLFSAYAWLKNPFIGGFFEQTMVINESVTREAGKQWALQQKGFRLGDQLVSVGGQPISSADDLRQVLEAFRVGDMVHVAMRSPDGQLKEADIKLQSLSTLDQISYFVIPAFLSLVFLVISLWIFGLRRSEPAGRTFSVLTTSMAIVIGGLFDLYTSHYFTMVWTLAVALAGGALVGLGLVFPQEARVLFRRPYLRWIGFAIGILLALNAYLVLYNFDRPTAYIGAWRNIYIFVALSGLYYFGTLARRAFFSLSPVVKNQARTILIGALLAFGPMVFWLLYSTVRSKIVPSESTPFNPLPVHLFDFLPDCQWICGSALPAAANRLLAAPGHGVFPVDHFCDCRLWFAGQRTRFDLFRGNAIQQSLFDRRYGIPDRGLPRSRSNAFAGTRGWHLLPRPARLRGASAWFQP